MTLSMASTIIPVSDQLNSDDLIGGPRTIRITGVSGCPDPKQPIAVAFDGDDEKPYKPCKIMRRVMVFAWGDDAHQYMNKRMTLFRDPEVVYGGMKVGGIRISHMSHIDAKFVIALSESKAKRKPFTVNKLADEAPPVAVAASDPVAAIEGWIARKLPEMLANCTTSDEVATVENRAAFVSAMEKGTDDQKKRIMDMVIESAARLDVQNAPEHDAI